MTTEREKLDRLVDIEEFEDLQSALFEWSTDSVVPGICMNPRCDNVEDVEPDCRDGRCSECQTDSIKSGLILARFF